MSYAEKSMKEVLKIIIQKSLIRYSVYNVHVTIANIIWNIHQYMRGFFRACVKVL